MTTFTSEERERQRFTHLVLGRPRPKPTGAGARRKSRKAKPIPLAPGIEEAVQLRERWSHKQGTPETHENHQVTARRPGSIARLYDSGAIDDQHVRAAQQISDAYWSVVRDVTVRTASLETRIDGGRHGKVEEEKLGAVIADLAYDSWRRAIGADGEALLDVIVHDVGLTIVARRLGMGMVRARRHLIHVLDLWWVSLGANRAQARAIVEGR